MRTSDRIYQFTATLRNIAPPIWRRIHVWGGDTLDQFHGVLQVAMGWENCHEYEFFVAGSRYRVKAPEDESKTLDSRQVRIQDVFTTEGAEFEYAYDFGDYWQHNLKLERILTADPYAACPCCFDGGRSCPPEDVGGFRGYQTYLAAIADPSHEQHSEMTAWRGAFDPETFSFQRINQQLYEKFHSVRKRKGALRSNAAKYQSSPEELRQAVAALPGLRLLQGVRARTNESHSSDLVGGASKLIKSDGVIDGDPSVSEIESSRNDASIKVTHEESHSLNVVEEPRWSQVEKKVAQKAFDLALKRELQTVKAKVRKRAERIKDPSDLWNLEHYFTECRKRINRQFDYRYSGLIQVFGELLHRGRLHNEDLHGLSEDKLVAIRRYAAFLASPMPGAAE